MKSTLASIFSFLSLAILSLNCGAATADQHASANDVTSRKYMTVVSSEIIPGTDKNQDSDMLKLVKIKDQFLGKITEDDVKHLKDIEQKAKGASEKEERELLKKQNKILRAAVLRAGFRIVADKDHPGDFEYHVIVEKSGEYFCLESKGYDVLVTEVSKSNPAFPKPSSPDQTGLTPEMVLKSIPGDSQHLYTIMLLTDGDSLKSGQFHFQKDIIQK